MLDLCLLFTGVEYYVSMRAQFCSCSHVDFVSFIAL